MGLAGNGKTTKLGRLIGGPRTVSTACMHGIAFPLMTIMILAGCGGGWDSASEAGCDGVTGNDSEPVSAAVAWWHGVIEEGSIGI